MFRNPYIDAETMRDMESVRSKQTPRDTDRNEAGLAEGTPINSLLPEGNERVDTHGSNRSKGKTQRVSLTKLLNSGDK